MLGVGSADVLDSYLSPYSYKGLSVRFMHETMRTTHLCDEHIMFQSIIDVDGFTTKSHAGNRNEYGGGARYSAGWYYQLHAQHAHGERGDTQQPFNIAGGLQASAYAGGIYNTKGGNNPAQGHFDVMLNLSALATYQFKLHDHTMRLRYQVCIPLLGAMFSPHYGQSYYEAFVLKQYDRNVRCATFVNAPTMRHLLTADYHVNSRNAIRIGYGGHFNQSTTGGIRYHSYTHNFLIGYTKAF